MTVHNRRADSPITTQNTTVFTVEFTKKLLRPRLPLEGPQPLTIH